MESTPKQTARASAPTFKVTEAPKPETLQPPLAWLPPVWQDMDLKSVIYMPLSVSGELVKNLGLGAPGGFRKMLTNACESIASVSTSSLKETRLLSELITPQSESDTARLVAGWKAVDVDRRRRIGTLLSDKLRLAVMDTAENPFKYGGFVRPASDKPNSDVAEAK